MKAFPISTIAMLRISKICTATPAEENVEAHEMSFPAKSVKGSFSHAAKIWLLGFLVLPGALLTAAAIRNSGTDSAILWAGAGLQTLICTWTWLNRNRHSRRFASAIVLLYLFGLA